MPYITKKQKWLFVVMFIVIAYGVYDFTENSEQYLRFYTGRKTTSTLSLEKIKPNDSTSPNGADVGAKYKKGWGSDPFYDPGLSRTSSSPKVRKQTIKEVHLELKAISYNGRKSMAIINEAMVMNGDVVEGYRVAKIEPDRVVLVKGKATKILTLK